MKRILILCLAALFWLPTPTSLHAQNRPIRKLYKKYRDEENTVAFCLPHFALKLGTGLGSLFISEEDREAGLDGLIRLAWDVRKIRFLNISDGNPVTSEELQKDFEKMRKKGHEDFLFIRNKGSRISIMVRTKKDKLRSLLILVSEKDSFTLIHLKTKIPKKDIQFLVEKVMAEL